MFVGSIVCVAIALIAPARQVPAAAGSWTDRAWIAKGSASELDRLLRDLRPLAEKSGASDDVRGAFAKSLVWLAMARIDARSDLGAVAQSVEEARWSDPKGTEENTRASLEYRWAEMLVAKGQRTLAREVLARAVEMYPDATMRPVVETLLASVLLQQNHYDAAFAALDRAEARVLPGDELNALGDIEGVRGEVWLALGAPDMAFECFESSARLAESWADAYDDYATLVQARLRQAALALATDDLHRVGELLDDEVECRAREMGHEACSQLLVRRGLADCALARERKGDPIVARDMLAAALADPSIPDIDALAAELALADLALSDRDLRTAEDRIDACLRRTRQWKAEGDLAPPRLEIALLEAHRSHLALLRHDSISVLVERAASLRSAIHDLLEAVRAVPVRSGGIGFLHWATQRHVLSTLVDIELAIDPSDAGKTRVLEMLAEVQTAGTLARTVEAPAVSVEDIRRDVLGPSTGLLFYLPSLENSYVFMLDRDSIDCSVLASGVTLEEPIARLLEVISVPPSAAQAPARRRTIDQCTRALADALMPESVQSKLHSWSSVIIVGADLLENLPFECLPMSDGRRLGIARALSRMPSLPIAVWLARRSMQPGPVPARDIVLLAAPTASTEDLSLTAPLVVDPADQERLIADFPRDRRVLLSGAGATISALEDATAGGAIVTALMTHGLQDFTRSRDGERTAGLLMTPERSASGKWIGGVLWCADVRRIHAVRLVELLSCGSERGPSRLGDDIGAHLGGAFFEGGAETIVASRFDIARVPTIELSVFFHDRLYRFGDAPAEAMRRARESIASDPATDDPYYWALLSVEGLADRPLFEAKSGEKAEPIRPTAMWVIASALIAVLAAVVLARRRSRISG